MTTTRLDALPAARVHGAPAVVVAPTPRPPPPSVLLVPPPTGVAAASLLSLQARLARLQVRLVDAAAYTGRALAQLPRVEVDGQLEGSARDSMRALAADEGASTDGALLLRAALDAHGARGVAQARDALLLARDAIAGELPVDRRPSFVRRADALLASFASAALAAPDPTPSAARAYQSMIASADALSGPLSRAGIDGFPFTNESGLAAALRHAARTRAAGGAAVGVSGAVLDVGAVLRADAIVSLDLSPLVRAAVLGAVGILLSVHEAGEREGWSGPRRAFEAQRRLGHVCTEGGRGAPRGVPSVPLPLDDVVHELRGVGLPVALEPSIRTALERMRADHHGASYASWCRGPDVVGHIDHLTRLALEGRIVAGTGDVSDPDVAARINGVLDALGTSVSSINLSNVLDYVEDPEAVVRVLGTLRSRDDVVAASTTLEIILPAEVAARVGSFSAPCVQPFAAFAGADGIAAALGAAIRRQQWRQLYQDEAAAIAGRWQPVDHIFDEATYTAEIARLSDRVFGTPDAARDRAYAAFASTTSFRHMREILSEEALRAALPVATSLVDMSAQLATFRASFWTRERRAQYFDSLAARMLPPEEAAALRSSALETSTGDEVCSIVAARAEALREQRFWTDEVRRSCVASHFKPPLDAAATRDVLARIATVHTAREIYAILDDVRRARS